MPAQNSVRTHLIQMILAALFAALTYVGTVFIQIPIPLGYVNLGDAFAVLAGFLLGPVYGAVAGGLGAMLGDLTLGYAQYAPVTLVLKAAMALIAAGAVRLSVGRTRSAALGFRAAGGAVAAAVMAGGYLLYETVLYGFAGALVTLPFNAVQGAVGAVLALLLYPLLSKLKSTIQ